MDAHEKSFHIHGGSRVQVQNSLLGKIVGNDRRFLYFFRTGAQGNGLQKTVPLLPHIAETGWNRWFLKCFPVDILCQLPQPFRKKIAVGNTGIGTDRIAMGLMGRNDKHISYNQRGFYAAEIMDAGPSCNQREFIKPVHVGLDMCQSMISLKSHGNG